ncbi:hypothetical protein FQN57_001852 [Myotisia sp. PD_48]|nr:hypothetical protein FQN57_001852 [Myotisia sp. PD_48]
MEPYWLDMCPVKAAISSNHDGTAPSTSSHGQSLLVLHELRKASPAVIVRFGFLNVGSPESLDSGNGPWCPRGFGVITSIMASVPEANRDAACGSTRWTHLHHMLQSFVALVYPISLLPLLRFFSKAHYLVSYQTHQSSTTIVPQTSRKLPCLDDETKLDSQFWEDAVGTALKTLMGGAGYDAATLQENLTFVSQSVAPFLGARPVQSQPPGWKSFMTDDHSPLEYSWNWDEDPPIVRFSFEPIGPLAGTSEDPFNHQAPMAYVDHLRSRLPAADWRWFTHFAEAFYIPPSPRLNDGQDSRNDRLGPTEIIQSNPSSIFIGFDLGRDGRMMCKMYIVPVKAEQTGQSRFTVLHDAIRTLPQFPELPGYTSLEGFLRRKEEVGAPAHIIGVAVDCVDPSASKLKIYFRNPTTTFASVQEALTAGGMTSSWDGSALQQLKDLWYLVFGLPVDFPEDQELPSKSHETSGVLYNFDIKMGNKEPETKVYIPVRHYGQNDRAIAEGLVEFLQRYRGHRKSHKGFLQTLERYTSYRSLDHGCGVQTYIACAFKRGKLSLTSYLSAEIYHPDRWSQAG